MEGYTARLVVGLVSAAVTSAAHGQAPAAAPETPGSVLAAAPAGDWTPLAPDDLLVVELGGGARVVVALADGFAPVHAANIRRLAHDHWYDGLAVERVQDDYVAQWGDPDGRKPADAAVVAKPPAEYDRPAAGLPIRWLPDRDAYAARTGVAGVFPVAVGEDGRAWLTHCYGAVGVGRDLNPDTGTGAELYAVIGQPARALDRNIAVVGRVVSGIEALSSLPRGTADLGFYSDPSQRLPITRVRLASDLAPDERPRLEALRPESASYTRWLRVKANRQDSFFVRAAGAVDLCNALPPVRARRP
jgi:peptidylprolyl isomerase